MSKVKEFMNPNVISVGPEDTLEKVVKIFKEHKINGLPVVNMDNKVVGILSSRDLLKQSEKTGFAPLSFYHGAAPDYTFLVDDAAYKRSVEEFLSTKVEDVMTTKVIFIKEHNSWHEAAELMKKRGVNRLPVINDEGRLTGIITRTDLLNFIAKHEALV